METNELTKSEKKEAESAIGEFSSIFEDGSHERQRNDLFLKILSIKQNLAKVEVSRTVSETGGGKCL